MLTEHVGVVCDGDTEVGVCCFLPLVVERVAVDVFEAHCCHTACNLG